MNFSIISETFAKMEATSKRLELIDILVNLFKIMPKDVIRNSIYLLQGKLRPNFEGIELGIAEKLAIKAISKSTGLPIKKIENDYRDGGDLGTTTENMLKLKTQTTFKAESITLERVYETLLKISTFEGKGSQDLKIKHISSLLNDATPNEGKFLLKILLGTLRLGIAENTIMDALAIAFTGEKENRKVIENAYNVSSDLGLVSEVVANNGKTGIEKFQISIFFSSPSSRMRLYSLKPSSQLALILMYSELVGSADSSIKADKSLFTNFQITPPKVRLNGPSWFSKSFSLKGLSVPNSENPAVKIVPITFCLLCSMLIGLLIKFLYQQSNYNRE